MAIQLETILNREKEVFNTFISNNGREVSLQPLLIKYSKEDLEENEKYPYTILFEYLKMYTTSLLITEEELKKYKKVVEIPKRTILKRGREIIERLIENGNRWNELGVVSKHYALEDGRYRSYSAETLKNWVSAYLKDNDDEDLIEQYNKTLKLSSNRRKAGYDIQLLDALLEFKDINKASDYIESICISKKSMNELLSAYKIIYPKREEEIEYITEAIFRAFENGESRNKFVKINSSRERKKMRVQSFKNLLEEYVISDIEKIETLFDKYNFTRYKFEETYKDLENTTDEILKILITRYEAKIKSIEETRRLEIEKILQAKNHSIAVGRTYRTFNYYDLKQITDMSFHDILKYSRKFFTEAEQKEIQVLLSTVSTGKVYSNRKELFESVNYAINGRRATDADKKTVIEYMEIHKWPYSDKLMMDTLERYLRDNVTLV